MAQRIPKALHHFRCYATILLLQETQTKVIQVIMFLKIIMGNQKKMLNYREKQLGHRPKMVHREHLLRNVSLMDSFTFFQVCVKTLADGQKNNETLKKTKHIFCLAKNVLIENDGRQNLQYSVCEKCLQQHKLKQVDITSRFYFVRNSFFVATL